MGKAKAAKIVLVMLESLAGTGHSVNRCRPKLSNKMEIILFDPFVRAKVLYREKKKLRTL